MSPRRTSARRRAPLLAAAPRVFAPLVLALAPGLLALAPPTAPPPAPSPSPPPAPSPSPSTVPALAPPLAGAAVGELQGSTARARAGAGRDTVAYWTGSVAEARRHARERNVPFVWHVILEDEERNDYYRDDILPDAKLVKASRDCVVCVANNGKHELVTVEREVDGETVETRECSAYGTPDCTSHQRLFDEAYAELQGEDGEMGLPQTVVALPDGKVVFHDDKRDPPTTAQIVAAITKARKLAGPGLSPEELVTVRGHAQVAASHAEASSWPRAWHAWRAVLDVGDTGTYAERAREELPKVEEALRAKLAALEARLVPGEAGPAYGELVALHAELAGVPLQNDVRKAIRRAERKDDVEDEIEAWKVAQEAEELWREARQCFAADDAAGGERLIRRLLRSEKYRDTPAAARARAEYPRWAEEEAGGG